MTTAYRLLAALLLGGLLAVPPSARAAESYDSCAGYIDSLPATISRQGVWCLRKNLSASIGNGNAITIATNDVTIECNDFRGGGLAAGWSTHTSARGWTLRGRRIARATSSISGRSG